MSEAAFGSRRRPTARATRAPATSAGPSGTDRAPAGEAPAAADRPGRATRRTGRAGRRAGRPRRRATAPALTSPKPMPAGDTRWVTQQRPAHERRPGDGARGRRRDDQATATVTTTGTSAAATSAVRQAVLDGVDERGRDEHERAPATVPSTRAVTGSHQTAMTARTATRRATVAPGRRPDPRHAASMARIVLPRARCLDPVCSWRMEGSTPSPLLRSAPPADVGADCTRPAGAPPRARGRTLGGHASADRSADSAAADARDLPMSGMGVATSRKGKRRILDGDAHAGEPTLDAAAGERSVLVRERPQVQALPQALRGPGAARRRVADARGAGRASGGPRTPRPATRSPGTSPASSRPRSSPGCAGPARVAAEILRLAGEMVRPGHHDRRDRRLRPPAARRARRLPVAAELQRLPEERLHVGQRGDLPRHPRHPGAAGRRHPQHRRHVLRRRRPRRHQRHVLRRRRRPDQPPARARHRGVHVARHRGGAARAGRSATSAGPSRTTPRPTATASSGPSSATASASSSTATSRCCTTTTRGRR